MKTAPSYTHAFLPSSLQVKKKAWHRYRASSTAFVLCFTFIHTLAIHTMKAGAKSFSFAKDATLLAMLAREIYGIPAFSQLLIRLDLIAAVFTDVQPFIKT
jgi:hypothetical protein